MLFLSFPKNQLARIAAHWSPLMRYAMSVGVCGGLLFGWYVFVCRGLYQVQEQYRHKVEQLRQEYALLDKEKEHYGQLQVQQGQVAATLTQYAQQQRDDTLTFLLQQIQQAHLSLDSLAPLYDVPKEWYVKKRFSCTVKGSFEHVMQLLEALSCHNGLLYCRELVLHKVTDEVIQANMVIDVLWLTECGEL